MRLAPERLIRPSKSQGHRDSNLVPEAAKLGITPSRISGTTHAPAKEVLGYPSAMASFASRMAAFQEMPLE
jgi:hypothetical protein